MERRILQGTFNFQVYLYAFLSSLSTFDKLSPNASPCVCFNSNNALTPFSGWCPNCHYRTGYERHVKAYTSPVQSSATILRGEPGADGVDMEGKVVVITG
jgi:hypothetical protein